jgi:2-keto-4-pentenoate hydratase
MNKYEENLGKEQLADIGLPLVEKLYEIILWLYPCINKFPKSQRFVLGQRIENTVLLILEKSLQAAQESGAERLKTLKRISIEMDKLRYLIRLSKDLHFIKIRQYGFISDNLNEAGKMLGGWVRSCYSKQNKKSY